MVPVVFSAHRLQSWIGRFAPPLDHVQRLVEGVRVLDHHACFQHVAVGGDLVALDRVLLFGMRRAENVDETVPGGKAHGIDDEFAILITPD